LPLDFVNLATTRVAASDEEANAQDDVDLLPGRAQGDDFLPAGARDE
jgi:hypothetical protein